MKTNLIDINKLRVPNNFAKEKGISKAMIYMLMKDGIIDWIWIDGYKFVHLTEKTLKYKKTQFNND
jgi:hypothetical protein